MQTLPLEFTGSGREYFRIWIVNLCLTLLTFGIYSAWAKVRRLQYFYRNTRLQHAVFDFHGQALMILRGRLLALCMFVLLPLMARSALRFRLANSSYRGLRFSFGGSRAGAWLAYGPPLAMLLLPPLLILLDVSEGWLALPGLLYFAWPWMHWRIQHYQYHHLHWARLDSRCGIGPGAFFRSYLKALLLGLAAALLAAMLIAALFGEKSQDRTQMLLPTLTALLLLYLIYLFTFPWLQGRLLNLVLSQTRFGPLHCVARLPLAAYLLLVTKNTVLTLLTLGLYRPFAVVALWRFRLRYLQLQAPAAWVAAFDSLDGVQEGAAGHAGGDGVADMFGFDLSW